MKGLHQIKITITPTQTHTRVFTNHVHTHTLLISPRTDWAAAKSVLGDSNFLKRLYDYDKDHMPDNLLKKLKKFIENPKFNPESVEKVSRACKSLVMWVRAMELYARVYRTVEPKRARLAVIVCVSRNRLSVFYINYSTYATYRVHRKP